MDLRERILALLHSAEEPVPTLEIAKKMGLVTAKDVNPTLYSLAGSKLVEKISEEGGSRPRWRLSPQAGARDKVLSYLQGLESGKSPLEIKRALNLNLSKAELNSLLYALQKEGLVKKEANADGTQPKWSLV
jgi:DNA-binding IclR family transcriptional regulator